MSATDEPLLTVSGVYAGYGEVTVLRDISISVQESETVVVIGPNGHGKTTLLRAISGLIRPKSGSIRFDGRDIDRCRAEAIAKLGIVHVPQGDHLFGDLTVEENLLMGAFPRIAWQNRNRALRQACAIFPGLHDRLSQRAHTLSGGERRQVALGRGLMRQPRLLIIDEPSLGLAPIVIDAVYEVIRQIATAGTSLLLVEENFAHIEGLADAACVLEMGQIVRAGKPKELLADPAIARVYLGGGE